MIKNKFYRLKKNCARVLAKAVPFCLILLILSPFLSYLFPGKNSGIAYAASSGPNNPATAVDDSSVGTKVWSNITNVYSSDNAYALVSFPPPFTTHYIKATNFSFSIPAGSTIDGVVVEVERKWIVAEAASAKDNAVRIVKGGTIGTTDRADTSTNWPTTDTYKTYGSSTDLWGETWTASDINASTFGFAISAVTTTVLPPEFATILHVDHIRITVYYTAGSTITISSPADLTLSAITGTGSSSGSVTWNIQTSNAAGYKMEWEASAAAMTSGADTIAAYGPAAPDTPEAWTVEAIDSEWGARLSSTSTDTYAEWGTDGASEKWLNVVATPSNRIIVQRTSATPGGGSNQVVQFKVEIGNNKFQPTGTYTVNITITATTL